MSLACPSHFSRTFHAYLSCAKVSRQKTGTRRVPGTVLSRQQTSEAWKWEACLFACLQWYMTDNLKIATSNLRPNKKILSFPVTQTTHVKKLRPKKFYKTFWPKRFNGPFYRNWSALLYKFFSIKKIIFLLTDPKKSHKVTRKDNIFLLGLSSFTCIDPPQSMQNHFELHHGSCVPCRTFWDFARHVMSKEKEEKLCRTFYTFCSMRIYHFAGHLKFSPDISGESGGFRVLCHLPTSIRYMESDVYEPIVQVAEVGSTISDGFHLHPLNTCSLIWLSLISRQTKNTALRKKEKGTILYTHKNNTR